VARTRRAGTAVGVKPVPEPQRWATYADVVPLIVSVPVRSSGERCPVQHLSAVPRTQDGRWASVAVACGHGGVADRINPSTADERLHTPPRPL